MLSRFLNMTPSWLDAPVLRRVANVRTLSDGPHKSSATMISPTVWLSALIGISLFALTAPLTTQALDGFSVVSIGAGRGVIGGAIALLVILFSRWQRPNNVTFMWLLLATPGLVFGFPYLLTLALTDTSSADVGVVLAALPLLTAVFSALVSNQRLPARFWGWALSGSLITASYFLLQSDWSAQQHNPVTRWILLAALVSAAWGYTAGAQAAKTLGGWQTICWVQAVTAPISALVFGWSLGQNGYESIDTTTNAILSLVYLGVFSQLVGFRFWFQALAVDPTRVSQIQLLQPLVTLTALSIFWQASVSGWQWSGAIGILVCVIGAMKTKQA